MPHTQKIALPQVGRARSGFREARHAEFPHRNSKARLPCRLKHNETGVRLLGSRVGAARWRTRGQTRLTGIYKWHPPEFALGKNLVFIERESEAG